MALKMASQIIRLTNVKLEGSNFCVLTPESFRTIDKPVLQIQDFKLNTDSVIAAQSHAFKLKYDVKLQIFLQGRSIMTIEDLTTVGGLMKRLIHHVRYTNVQLYMKLLLTLFCIFFAVQRMKHTPIMASCSRL